MLGMTTVETVRRFLADAAGKALCDSCLAFGCAISLSEMRHVTEELRRDVSFHAGGRCSSCRRTVQSIVYSAKCAHCSHPVLPGQDALEIAGDFFHAPCFLTITSLEKIRTSRKLNAESRRLIEDARQQIREQRQRNRSRDC